jgi:predicted transcriptional regulator
MKVERKIGASKLAKELGITTSTIGKYVKLGMPHDEDYRGLMPSRKFNVEECKEWIKSKRGE